MRTTTYVALAALLAVTVGAQEKIALTTPETKPSNAEYRLGTLTVAYDDPGTPQDEGVMVIGLVGQNGEQVRCEYNSGTSPTATTLNNGLNKANLSSAYNNNATTGSLKQRVYHRLVIMGEAPTVCAGKSLVGTLTGNPQ